MRIIMPLYDSGRTPQHVLCSFWICITFNRETCLYLKSVNSPILKLYWSVEPSYDLLIHRIMFDIGLFVNKKYSVHIHCSNNKLLLKFRVSARIEQPVSLVKKKKQPAWMFQVPLSFWRLIFVFAFLFRLDPYWSICRLVLAGSSLWRCPHVPYLNVMSGWWIWNLSHFVVTWLTCGFIIPQWKERKGYFKPNASVLQKLCHRDIASWLYNFYF